MYYGCVLRYKNADYLLGTTRTWLLYERQIIKTVPENFINCIKLYHIINKIVAARAYCFITVTFSTIKYCFICGVKLCLVYRYNEYIIKYRL